MSGKSPDEKQHKPSKRSKRALRMLKRLGITCGVVVLAAGCLALSLPWLLSSGWMRGLAAEQLGKASGRPASLGALSFGWADGLRLSELRIGQGDISDERLLVTLRSLHLDVGLLPLLRSMR